MPKVGRFDPGISLLTSLALLNHKVAV